MAAWQCICELQEKNYSHKFFASNPICPKLNKLKIRRCSLWGFFAHCFPGKAMQNIEYRLYSPSLMTNAYLAVKDKNMSVRRAAQQYSVPETTLRQRVLGR